MAFLKKYALSALLASLYLGLMLMVGIHFVDVYRAGGSFGTWIDGGHLQTMRGWHTIEHRHPHVIRGTFPGTFYVEIDHATFATNYSIDDDLYTLLDTQAE